MSAEMTPEVPAAAQAALQAIVESGQAQWYLSGGEKIEFTAIDFCAWYMAERRRIREQVAQEARDAAAEMSNPERAILRWFAERTEQCGEVSS